METCSFVPNVPCGVERYGLKPKDAMLDYSVPNVPCGVERYLVDFVHVFTSVFLMYRVELKDLLPYLVWVRTGSS